MTLWVRKWLEDPRLWLSVGAVCFVVSFLLGYHQAQVVADQALAVRSAPPPTVTIQDVPKVRDASLTREIRILAETDIGAPVSVDVTRADGSVELAVFYPLYPVSRAGRDALLSAEGALPRPQPRPYNLGAGRPPALGIAVFFAKSADAAKAAADQSFGAGLGGGRFGRVVEIKGAEVTPGDLELVAKGAIAARGGTLASEFLSVKPFTKSRMEAVALPELSPWHGVLQWVAVLSGVAAIYFSLRPHIPARRRRRKSRQPDEAPQVTLHRTFSPIATQDEIHDAEEAARARAHVAHPVMRMLDAAFQETKGALVSRIRSRQSRRVD